MKRTHNRIIAFGVVVTIFTTLTFGSLMFGSVSGPWLVADAATKIKTTNQRIAGTNRYETSFSVTEAMGKNLGQVNNMVVACGKDYPDALSGGYLLKVKNASLLLETPSYDKDVLSHIQKYMNPKGTVFILGGASAVGTGLEDQIKAKGFKVERLAGANRYATNLEVLKKVFASGSELLVASGKGYADALSGSAVGLPMLLVGDSLTKDQINWLKKSKIKKIYILGGASAVSSSIETALKKYATTERLAGVNRYDTSRKVANKFFSKAKSVTLISGKNFPDGLSGAPISMYNGAPILLTSSEEYQYAKSFVVGNGIVKTTVVGGTSAVPESTVKKIMDQYEGGSKHVHIWTPSFSWSKDLTEATATFKCMDCEKTESEDADVSFKITKPATHYSTGIMSFIAKAKDPDGITRKGTKAKILPKIFHQYEYKWDLARYNSGSKIINCKAYAYVAGGYGASGKPAIPGTVAVDRSVIPLGTKLYVEGYGFATANDTGGNIVGKTIDVVMNSEYTCYQWGVKYVNVYILN